MAKYWKYKIQNLSNIGTAENPNWVESFTEKMITATKANEAIAKAEAYNGEYVIEDDGQPEVYQPTIQEQLDAQAAAIVELMGVIYNG